MIDKASYFLSIFLIISLIGCESGKKRAAAPEPNNPGDSGVSKILQEDIATDESTANLIKPIQINFKRINSITNWVSIDSIELSETTEGGEATFYYSPAGLEKIVTHEYGEIFQQLTEYYLLNKEISFVYEKTYKYNRPMYYDSAAMKDNKDDQVFDFKKSEIIEQRSYFADNKLLQQVNTENHRTSLAKGNLEPEQKRIAETFKNLIKLSK